MPSQVPRVVRRKGRFLLYFYISRLGNLFVFLGQEIRSIFLITSVVFVVCLMSWALASWCIAPLSLRQLASATSVDEATQSPLTQDGYDRRSLVAQQDMSLWTFWAVIISAGGLFTSIGALLLVGWTLAATRSQLKEAQEANKNSRQQIVAAHRPWVFSRRSHRGQGSNFTTTA